MGWPGRPGLGKSRQGMQAAFPGEQASVADPHLRSCAQGGEEKETLPTNWEDWGEFGDFTGLMEDVSLYPSSLGLFDRTILTRVQKRDQDKDQGKKSLKKREASFSNDEHRGGSTQPEVENIFISMLPKKIL